MARWKEWVLAAFLLLIASMAVGCQSELSLRPARVDMRKDYREQTDRYQMGYLRITPSSKPATQSTGGAQ